MTCDRGTWFIAQFVANQGFIVVTADNRGTPCRGAAWEKAIKFDYRELPLRDQVTAIKALAAQDPSMDLSRGVGVFGWSYGGYMSALAVMCYPSLYTAGFVGAPVCDWRDYGLSNIRSIISLDIATIELLLTPSAVPLSHLRYELHRARPRSAAGARSGLRSLVGADVREGSAATDDARPRTGR